MPPLLSIIIPTYNRPEQLLATLRFLQARAIRLPIFVADGSDENFAPQNRECTKLGDNISYVHSPAGSGEGPWQNYRRRISEVLNAVATPYVVYCADDDLLIIENAVKAAKFLETHVDYIGCHGTYLHYRTVDDKLRIEGTAYDSPSIDGNEAAGRLVQLFSRYEAVFYAVFRTKTKRMLIDFYEEREQPLWPEIYHATGAALAGKIKRLDNLFTLRNIGLAPHAQKLDNFGQWVVSDFDGFFAGYLKYRERFATWLIDRSPNIDRSSLKQAFDLSFMIYIGSEFDPRLWIAAYLDRSIVSESEKSQLRTRLESQFLRTPTNQQAAGNDNKEALKTLSLSLLGERQFRLIQKARDVILLRSHQSATGIDQKNKVQIAPHLIGRFPDAEWSLLRN